MIRKGMRSAVLFLLAVLLLLVLFSRRKRAPASPSPSMGERGWPGSKPLFDMPGADTVLSPSLPRRGNRLTRACGRLLYTLLGWRIEGQFPDAPKLIVVGAPHTSYWDTLLAIGFFLATGLDCRWMVTRKARKYPWGGFMRWMGAIFVNREDPGNIVQHVIDEMNRSGKFVLVITPEGALKKVDQWKTGFHRIALATGTPITLAYADFGSQVVGIGPTYQPSEEMETQIEEMRAFYRGITARNPEWA